MANPLYKGALVTFYTVAAGEKTSVKASLYAGSSGSATLANPQSLDSRGKLKQPVYHDVELVASIGGIHVPSHDTGIVAPPPTFRVASTGEVQYSFDGGASWNATGDFFFRQRGPWAGPGSSYERNDMALFGADRYIALSDHASTASFAADLAAGKWQFAWREPFVNAKNYGAVGDGVTDDTVAMGNFFDAVNGAVGLIPAGTYKLASLLSKALTNTTIIGVPGQTIITGSFGYAVMRLLELSNVHFYGITFQTTYVNAAEDTGTAVVYSFQNSVVNVSFKHCKFTSPSANTNGLSVYARISALDTSAVIDGLWIEDCDFIDVGRIAISLMNRYTGVGKNNAAKRVYVDRNRANNLGTQGSFGFFITLDGFGCAFTVDDNLIEDALITCIENTGWSYGSISNNRFNSFNNPATSAFSIDGTGNGTMVGLQIVGNKTMAPQTTHSYIGLMDKSYVAGNYIEATSAAAQAVFVRDSNDNKFEGNYWKSASLYACFFEKDATTCQRNKVRGDTFDNSASASAFSTVRFSAANCSENELIDCTVRKGTGGILFDAIGGASNNVIRNAVSATNLGLTGFVAPNYTADADKTLELYELADVLQVGGAITATRALIFPSITRSWIVRNATGQTLTCKAATGTGINIATGMTAIIHWNGVNMARDTADV